MNKIKRFFTEEIPETKEEERARLKAVMDLKEKNKAPVCCKRFMELKGGYFSSGSIFSNPSYYIFQCKKCGKIRKEEEE